MDKTYTRQDKENKGHFILKTLMPSTSVPRRDKNEPARFLGDGVSFKAKLIGILEVSEARGDRMCQEALADLKMAIRAAGEHKQRININIAIDGLRLRDEKTGDCLYHHPVHKISFIAQDMSDSRAFGYIFGSPDTGHRFFGIKTDKAAGQVVITMRDLFQVVFELKKKEIEMAKQHIEQHQIKYSSSLFSDAAAKTTEPIKMRPIAEDRTKEGSCSVEGERPEHILDLLDLELELNNIQQGINQMERITPSDPFGPPSLPKLASDPFGDSFNPVPMKGKIPPPPDSGKRTRTSSEKHWFDQETEALFEETELPTSLSSIQGTSQPVFSPPSAPPVSVAAQSGTEEQRKRSESPLNRDQFDVFTDLDPLGTGRSKPYIDKKDFFQDLKNPPKKVLKDLVNEIPNDSKQGIFSDSEIEKAVSLPPNVPAETSSAPSNILPVPFADPFQEDPFDKDPFSEVDFSRSVFTPTSSGDPFEKFADFASFNTKPDDSSSEPTSVRKSPVPSEDSSKPVPLRVSLPPEKLSCGENSYTSPQLLRKNKLQKTNSVSGVIKLPSPKHKVRNKVNTQTSLEGFGDKQSPVMEGVTLRNRNTSVPTSSALIVNDTPAPEPPPRYGFNSISMKPPLLPPKRVPNAAVKPPPRPPHADYDYIENYHTTNYTDVQSPPLPAPARKPKISAKVSSETEYYLQPFPLLPPPKKKASSPNNSSTTLDAKPASSSSNKSLDITLSQLTKTGFSDLAATLNMSPTSLSRMTLQDLTKHLANLSNEAQGKEDPLNKCSSGYKSDREVDELNTSNRGDSVEDETTAFTAEFDAHFNLNNRFQSNPEKEESLFDKYAVFRELLEEEEKKQSETTADEIQEVTEKASDSVNEVRISEKNVPIEESQFVPPSEDRYAALRDICLDDVTEEKSEVDLSDKDDSIVEPSRMEEDADLLSQSRPQSESTESPTVTMKEHQSIMETTIMEEDISNLEVDEEDVPDESIDDTLRESVSSALPKPESVINPDDQTRSLPEKKSYSPSEEFKPVIESKVSSATSSNNTSWAKFDSTNVTVIENASSIHSEGHISPWSNESKDNDLSPACRDKRKHRKTRRHKHNQWPEDEESEEGWDGRIDASSWSPSWRENGWSDGDSLYDEAPPYMERDYPSPRRGRRRRVSPWNSRDQSPWEEDDRDLNEDHWESSRWQEEPRQRSKHRGPMWDEDRRRHYEDPRKTRKQMVWSSDLDRKSSRESLTWEDEDRYQKRNYMERRRRKWEEEGHSRVRGWRDRGDWVESGLKMNPRYYRDRSHDSHWDDEYSEHGDDESNRWSQRPRSCDRGRRQYSSHHSTESDFNERRYLRREAGHCTDMDYRRKAQTLQSQKSRRKHSQTSPFEDDFSTHFNFSKEINSPIGGGGVSDSFDSELKQSPVSFEGHKKCFTDSPGSKEFIESSNVTESVNTKGYRSYQQSPFEDDFTPPDTRRCSGRSASSDLSDPRGSDDVFYSHKEFAKPIESKMTKRPKSANQVENVSSSNRTLRNIGPTGEGDVEYNIKSYSRPEAENVETSSTPRVSEKKNNSDFKARISNLKRTESSTSLRKSESVNIFARNKDPFDDDFFCEDTSNVQSKDKSSKNVSSESIKWTDAFNAFSFDEEIK